ncbi:MAG: zinc ribbon domain-containing protein [Pedosphaera sp.]|nr:zinc ribbon domain-containing protein [Pedosphaera sp.]MSU42790.1 zinc ribbon domain-containing protein [Pedosphaera sp.]
MPPVLCPLCGEHVPQKARACPSCGADEKTGWGEEAYTANPDLPDEEFDYEDFTRREFGGKPEVKPQGLHWFWWAVGIAVLVALIWQWSR